MTDKAPITKIRAAAYTIPTDRPEGDGTFQWNSTTIIIAFAEAGGRTGIGYSYASASDALFVNQQLAGLLINRNVFDIPACWHLMRHGVRNVGVTGQAASAIAAVDTALWDLKARLLGISLTGLMGAARDAVPVYGSGGFTTYDDKAIERQIGDWRDQGITMAKIKIGADPEQDIQRVACARKALGPDGKLFVDANGAYTVKQALGFAEAFRDYDVSWFEEPVSSDNLNGLRQVRAQGPAGMDIAAGEYGYDLFYYRHMLDAQAVDVLQIDATRCEGYTGFIHAASLAMASSVPVSSHCAPALHLPVCMHAPGVQHMEYFYDHVRIEQMFFDGVPTVADGRLAPAFDAPGNGLTLKTADAERYLA